MTDNRVSRWKLFLDIGRATVELALARNWVASKRPVPALRKSDLVSSKFRHHAEVVRRVAFVIPRVAARLPWRTDCLVQAIAAKRWLESKGVFTELRFGVPKLAQNSFEAHAWLVAGEIVVVGGDVSRYTALKMCTEQVRSRNQA